MPRLIEEDKAKEVLTDYYHISTDIQQIALEEAFSRIPTVKAITVEWIKKWSGNEPYWANLAEHMLDDWEKENAKID